MCQMTIACFPPFVISAGFTVAPLSAAEFSWCHSEFLVYLEIKSKQVVDISMLKTVLGKRNRRKNRIRSAQYPE
jgi:hypothetical protein